MKCKYYGICGAKADYIDCNGDISNKYRCVHYVVIKREIENDIRNGWTKEQSENQLEKEARRFGQRIQRFHYK